MVSTASRPARGAWVEIQMDNTGNKIPSGRAPQGARGLKSKQCSPGMEESLSRPARGAWVEIDLTQALQITNEVAPRKGRVG